MFRIIIEEVREIFKDYLKVAVATPNLRVADCSYNTQQIRLLMERASDEKIAMLCLPQLCVTGSTCGDLFLQEKLLVSARNAFYRLVDTTQYYNVLTVLGISGLPDDEDKNMIAVIKEGDIIALFPGSEPNLLKCDNTPNFSLSVVLNHETPIVPNATIIAHLAADSETVGSYDYRHTIIKGDSQRFACGYLYANAGYGESTTNTVFSGHNLIYENGILLAESKPFDTAWAVSEIDLTAIQHKKRQKFMKNTVNTGQNTGQNTAQNTGLVNINTADATQLTTLPGIGATIANNIIAHREANGFFTSIEQLQNVPRIGATTFSNLRDLITVG